MHGACLRSSDARVSPQLHRQHDEKLSRVVILSEALSVSRRTGRSEGSAL